MDLRPTLEFLEQKLVEFVALGEGDEVCVVLKDLWDLRVPSSRLRKRRPDGAVRSDTFRTGGGGGGGAIDVRFAQT